MPDASSRRIVIAIDGPAGAGKSTIARRLADKLSLTYIDTGAMYRAVALWALRQHIDPADPHCMEQLAKAAVIAFEAGNRRVLLNGEDVTDAIRAHEVSVAASVAATVPGLRRALVERQREMAASASVVVEGRDIGSVVFPDADIKIFLDAETERRVQRRVAELHEGGESPEMESVSREMQARDRRDRSRTEAPLVQAPDATYIDSTGLTLDEVEAAILKLVRARISNGKDFS